MRKETLGTMFFTPYTSARQRYAPMMLAVINNSKIWRVTEMGIKKKKKIVSAHMNVAGVSGFPYERRNQVIIL